MSTILIATLSLAASMMPFRGTVTGVAVAPEKAQTGQEISITATGTNPCGAVHIITGDGAAVTHAITGLPSTHAHVYRKPGKYTIIAQGMGNCDGEAQTTIEVTGKPLDPEPPPAPRGIVTGIDAEPEPGRVGQPVRFTITGDGTCAVTLAFGDGNTRELRGALPQRVNHVYSVGGRYTIEVMPEAPCEGRQSRELEVTGARGGELTRVMISPAPARVGEPVRVSVEGSGRCAYRLDYGDGNTEPRNAQLPDAVTRYYHRAGHYTVTAAADEPCRGSDRLTFEVRGTARPQGVTGLDLASGGFPTTGSQLTFVVRGSGECRVHVDFGDGNRRSYTGSLPLHVPHVYARAGQFVIRAETEAPCGGSAQVEVAVGRGGA